jgi:hypothetical protein
MYLLYAYCLTTGTRSKIKVVEVLRDKILYYRKSNCYTFKVLVNTLYRNVMVAKTRLRCRIGKYVHWAIRILEDAITMKKIHKNKLSTLNVIYIYYGQVLEERDETEVMSVTTLKNHYKSYKYQYKYLVKVLEGFYW